MKKIKNYFKYIILSFMYYVFHIYKTNKVLDKYLNILLDYGIKEFKYNKYYMYITFNNGIEAKLWNQNETYAWLTIGYIDGISFDECGFKYKTQWRLKQLIIEYYKLNPIENKVISAIKDVYNKTFNNE